MFGYVRRLANHALPKIVRDGLSEGGYAPVVRVLEGYDRGRLRHYLSEHFDELPIRVLEWPQPHDDPTDWNRVVDEVSAGTGIDRTIVERHLSYEYRKLMDTRVRERPQQRAPKGPMALLPLNGEQWRWITTAPKARNRLECGPCPASIVLVWR